MPDTKGERLQIRLDTDAKAILQRAARYAHQSISQFVLDTALQEAKHVIRQHEKVVSLPEADWDAFFEALTTPRSLTIPCKGPIGATRT